jgi:hypothetical protein
MKTQLYDDTYGMVYRKRKPTYQEFMAFLDRVLKEIRIKQNADTL